MGAAVILSTTMHDRSSADDEKFETINKLLDDQYVLVHIDPSFSGVSVPENLKSQPALTLKFSRLFKGGIELKSAGIEASLLFGDRYFPCIVPFGAVWGATGESGENIVWPSSAPPEIQSSLKSAVEKGEPDPTEQKKEFKKGHLTRVK